MLYHYRPADAKPAAMPDGPEAKAHFEKEIDFHQMLSALGDYPEILRRLGLVMDFYIPADAIPKTNNNTGTFKLRIVPKWIAQSHTPQNNGQSSYNGGHSSFQNGPSSGNRGQSSFQNGSFSGNGGQSSFQDVELPRQKIIVRGRLMTIGRKMVSYYLRPTLQQRN